MAAGQEWELVASGPTGTQVKVEYFAGLQPLRVVKTYDDNPYRVRLEGLEPGLHAIYAITTVDGVQEISRPVTVFFAPRAQARD